MIDRRELVAALERDAAKKVTIVAAPAGSGKTSLLRAWTDRHGRHRRIASVSVQPDQHDAQLFWLTLLRAIRAACGTAGAAEPLPAAPSFDGGAMVDKVLSDLAGCPGPVVLVIDDLQELTSNDVLQDLGAMLGRLPAQAHAIVATRRDLPIRLHKLRLAGDLAEIRGPQLRFTQEETRELLTDSGVALPDRAVAQLHQRTEGWAAGLRLAALSLAGHPDPEHFVEEFSGSERTVADYLLAELLNRQPAHVRRMLLRTSVVDKVNGELADLLAGAPGSERILLELENANAFVMSLDPARTWFRYHNLFLGLLRLELRRTLPEEVPALHDLAARWLAQHGQVTDAIRQLQAAGDWARAARMLGDHSLSLSLDGQAETVGELLRSFPAQMSLDSPELAPVQAIADLDEMRLDAAAGRIEVARSYAATAPPDRQQRLRLQVASLDLLLGRLRGQFDRALERTVTLPAPATDPGSPEAALARDLRALALMNLGVTQAWSLHLRNSERHLADGAALAHEIGRPYLEVACLAYLGFASTAHSVADAQRRSEEALELATRHGWEQQPVIAPALTTLAGMMIWRGEWGAGEQLLDRARLAARTGSEPGIRLLLHMAEGMLHAATGRHREALEMFIAAGHEQSMMAGEHALTVRVVAWIAATQARLGMPEAAHETLATRVRRQARRGEIRNAKAVISLSQGDPEGARRELAGVVGGTAPVSHRLALIEAHLLDALACRDLGQQRAEYKAVERALNLAESDRLILPFAMTGAWVLLEALPPHETAHAALVAEVLELAGRDRRPAADHPMLVAETLSATELRVLRYLPTNLTRPEIAGELTISVNTVSTHVRRIYAKLGVTDRNEAVHRARELRLLGPR